MISSKKSLLLASGFTVALSGSADAAITSILLTSADLGLGGSAINSDKNGTAIDDDVAGKLVTSTDQNVGSVLSIQTDNLAGPGTALAPLLATVTARTHMDIVSSLPAGFDFQAGAITLTKDSIDLEKSGLGVRAFGIDLSAGANRGKRYSNPAFVTAGNPSGFQLEGSKEVSGGVEQTDFELWAAGQDPVPGNTPPHVDEDVSFDINDAELNVPADSVRVLITKIKAGNDNLFDVAIDVTINLVGGGVISNSYIPTAGAFPGIFSQVGALDILEIDFSGIAGTAGFNVDSFTIGARDDPADGPAETDEHFLIHGFTVDATLVPEPAAFALLTAGMGLIASRRRTG